MKWQLKNIYYLLHEDVVNNQKWLLYLIVIFIIQISIIKLYTNSKEMWNFIIKKSITFIIIFFKVSIGYLFISDDINPSITMNVIESSKEQKLELVRKMEISNMIYCCI